MARKARYAASISAMKVRYQLGGLFDRLDIEFIPLRFRRVGAVPPRLDRQLWRPGVLVAALERRDAGFANGGTVFDQVAQQNQVD